MLSARRHWSCWMSSGHSSSVSSRPRRSPRPRHDLADVDVLKPGDAAFPFAAAQAAAGVGDQPGVSSASIAMPARSAGPSITAQRLGPQRPHRVGARRQNG
jgi:hypothetical protein